jgi:hypothetical protein
MANADTRVNCTKCGAKLPVVPGAAERASPDATARKLADEWNAGLSLTRAVREAHADDADAASAASDASLVAALEQRDLSAHALTLGIAPDPVLTPAARPLVARKTAEPPVPTSRYAKLSFGLGLFSLIPPVAVYAIRYGYKGRAEVRESQGRVKGRGLATAGLVLGWAGIALFVSLFGLELFAHNYRSPMEVDESAAVGNLRDLSTALVAYASTYQNGFPSTLNPLLDSFRQETNCNQAGLVPQNRVTGQYKGYAFRYKPMYPDNQHAPAISPKAAAAGCVSGGASGYTLNADPVEPGKTGFRHFYIDQTGIIRYSASDKPADVNSPALQ